jgi:tetratricopeptide (TPR) repeat protein
MLPVTTSSEKAREQFEWGREAAFHWNIAQAHQHLAAWYQQVLERDADFFGGWTRPGWMRDVLASTYIEAGLFEEAERALVENIRLHPGIADNYGALGRLYLQLGRRDQAAEQFTAARKLGWTRSFREG